MTYATDLDHLVVNAARQIDDAVAAYARLGFHITPRGYHSLGSCNNLMIFRDTYLELLGAGEGELAETAAAFIAQPIGLVALALRGPDANDTHAALVAAGVEADAPLSFTRPVDLGEHTEDAGFTVVRLGPTVPGAGVFYCIHQTPHLVWRRAWQTHPNGAQHISVVTVVAEAHDQKQWRGFFAKGIGSARLEMLTPDQAQDQFGPALPVREAPYIAAITFEVTDIAATLAVLDQCGANHAQGIVAAKDAFGVALRFVQAPLV